MKSLFLIPVLFSLTIFFTGCKQRTISSSSADLDEFSRQLEQQPRTTNKSSEATINSNYQGFPIESAIVDSKILVTEITSGRSSIYPSGKLKNIVNYNGILNDRKQKQKIFAPKEFDTDNVFWRIGKTILKVGLAVMGLLGAISFGVSSNNGFLFSLFGGLLIGVIIMALSIPFFIIGIISEIMKNKNSNLENTNEI